ncbi:ABC transporter substrate-binding protein [Billgrantia kenyensis]|uniref:ABC transporter substrate-binding protein n=1 Tax=Billgrantia kenyensis TaxID=321266 RepID=A0A7V9W0Z1_9GAMM|nr:ABC transporter substrate-binding protein [Halomonas kenyensis]MBA2779055.1 ABC transporter substrate-binding protein [Halomonas kenyensis]MCG6660482.1 ABC transporter substrate-binding protein [Halomonas kenyensis]
MIDIQRRQLLQFAVASAALSAFPGLGLAASAGLQVASPLGLPQVILARALRDPRLIEHLGERELRTWRDPDQLRAWIAGSEVQLTATPTNVAANLYNRGVPVVLMNVNVWGTLGILGLDGELASLADLAGIHVGVPWRGDMPDLVLRYLLDREGMEIGRDLRVTYQASPFETVQTLLAQRLDAAVLPEPMRTSTRLQASSLGLDTVELDLQAEWARLTGTPPGLPQAGVICRRELFESRPEWIVAVQSAVAGAVDWVAANPAEAGQLGARYSSLPAPVIEGAIKRTRLEMRSATQARPELEGFLGALAELSPAFIGGGVPNDGFYLADDLPARG